MKSWLQDNDVEIFSTHNEAKAVVVERFIRTLNNKMYKYDFNVKNCVYWEITRYSSIEIKSINVKSRKHIDFKVENNEKDPKFEVGGYVRI